MLLVQAFLSFGVSIAKFHLGNEECKCFALVFTSTFSKNICLTRPKTSGMARFNIFMEQHIQGALFADTMEEALAFLARGEVVRFDQVALDTNQERSVNGSSSFKKVEASFLTQG